MDTFHDKVIGNKDDKGYGHFPKCSSCSQPRCKTKCIHTKTFLEKAEELQVTIITIGPRGGKYLRMNSIRNASFCHRSEWIEKNKTTSYICQSGCWTQTQLYRDAVLDYEANQ